MGSLFKREPTEAEIDSACMFMNHAFAMPCLEDLPDSVKDAPTVRGSHATREQKDEMRHNAKEWLHAWSRCRIVTGKRVIHEHTSAVYLSF